MRTHHLRVDRLHTRAIAREIAERLRAVLTEQPAPTRSLQALIDRLPELDDDSPPIAPE
jgi:hypothetical protein